MIRPALRHRTPWSRTENVRRHTNLSSSHIDYFYVTNPFQTRPVFGQPRRGILALFAYSDAAPHIRARRRIELCIGLSLLVHGLLFLISMQHHVEDAGMPSQATQGPLTVRLTHLPPPLAAAAAVQSIPKPRPTPPTKPRSRTVIAVSKPTPKSAPVTIEQPAPQPDRAPPPADMMAMLNAARARRGAANNNAANDNADAAESGREPSADEVAMANIKRNLQRATGRRDGTGGVFEILSKGVRNGQFAFRGWTPGTGSTWHETIEVDAGIGGNVELAMVRKMIELIRKHYNGDFNWESHKLGQVVVLSARSKDNAELEAFLMREFFGS